MRTNLRANLEFESKRNCKSTVSDAACTIGTPLETCAFVSCLVFFWAIYPLQLETKQPKGRMYGTWQMCVLWPAKHALDCCLVLSCHIPLEGRSSEHKIARAKHTCNCFCGASSGQSNHLPQTRDPCIGTVRNLILIGLNQPRLDTMKFLALKSIDVFIQQGYLLAKPHAWWDFSIPPT